MIQYHSIPEFTFANGTKLQNVRVAYQSINPNSTSGVVLIPTCFAGRIDTTCSFTQSPVNALAKYHVIVVAMLGNGESSSPSNTPGFPEPGQLQYEDVIRAHYHLLTQGLDVKQLQAVVGFSMGGQQAYYWSVMYPNFVKSIVGICTSARTSPHNYTFLEGPIAALENSFDYVAWKQASLKQAQDNNPGFSSNQTNHPTPKKGLSAFRRAYAAWLTSAEWFRSQRWKELGATSLDVWLKHSSEGNAEWNADDLLVLARMWQMGDIGKIDTHRANGVCWNNETDEDLERTLAGIACPVLLMPNRSDQYFRPSENQFEMKHLKQGRLEVIESDWGHISGGGVCPADAAFMSSKLADFLASL